MKTAALAVVLLLMSSGAWAGPVLQATPLSAYYQSCESTVERFVHDPAAGRLRIYRGALGVLGPPSAKPNHFLVVWILALGADGTGYQVEEDEVPMSTLFCDGHYAGVAQP